MEEKQDKNDVEQDIGQLQLIQQNLQTILMQKQQFQMQLNEIDSALQEIVNTQQAYKIIGNIMVAGKKEEIEADLKKKKEILEIRIKNLETQEQKLRSKVEDMQKGVVRGLKG
ncbi:prefoldin subunit beta [Nanoarchaeota archaeon]